MNAEVISIGDELTSGQRLDTNSQWLSERLGELGIRVLYHTTVADDLPANVDVFRAAAQRADVIISTGGLGPTADDLTREAIAAVLGVSLELDEASLEHIQGLFKRFSRDMPQRNRVQAMFPVGTQPIFNPLGTAPGIEAVFPRERRVPCRLFALPGVPAEMQQMWQETVVPRLAPSLGHKRMIRHLRIKCFGIGESHLEEKLPDLIRRGRWPQVGITVSGATITLRITADGATPEECHAAMQPTVQTIQECLGELIFGTEEDELQDGVVRLLAEQGKTLATVEWGTEGLIAHWLSEAVRRGPAATQLPVIRGSLVAADAAALAATLGADLAELEQLEAETGPLAQRVAEAFRERTGADYVLAVGRLPSFDPQAHEPKRAHYALASQRETIVRSAPFAGHPSILTQRAAKQALNMVRLALLHAE